MTRGPYERTARRYLAAGWGSPLPLPARRKKSPPDGWTGRTAPDASAADVESWCESHPDGNIAMRLAEGIIGIDVDAYKSEAAAKAWQQLVNDLGPLPARAPWCTSRDDGMSGIRLFRVPPGFAAAGIIGGGAGEIIQHHHRYIVAPPSIHPDTGQPYRWIGMPDGYIPDRDELPVLPTSWQDRLRAAAHAAENGGAAATTWTDPDLPQLAGHGIPDGANQDEYLRDLTWKLAAKGTDRANAYAVWLGVVSRTSLTRQSEPWTETDFDRHWDGAAAKLRDREPARTAGPFTVIDLEPATETVEPPVLVCRDRLYLGAIHTLTGPPDCGKTTLACWWMLETVRAGRTVVFLDEEGGRELVTEKFQALGAAPGERIAYIPFPGRAWNLGDLASLTAVLDERQPGLVAWDSSAAFLARAGLDENAAADVTRFYAQVLMLCARQHNAAVLVIDHDTKSSEPSRYARGSGAKLAATDVAYKLDPVRPFSRDTPGASRLITTKDRRGHLHRSHDITFTVEGGCLGVEFAETIPGVFRPTVKMGKICEVLTRSPGLGFNDLRDRVTGNEQVFREALAILVDEGYVIVTRGPHNSKLHEIAVPFNG